MEGIMAKHKDILIVASSPDSLVKVSCSCCDKNLVVSNVDEFCPICFSNFKDESRPVSLSDSSSALQPRLNCKECKSIIYSNSLKEDAQLAASMFCPKCGSAKVTTMDDEIISDSTTETFDDEEFDESEYQDLDELCGTSKRRTIMTKAQKTAKTLIKIYDEYFGKVSCRRFRINWPELRSIAGIPKLTDEYLNEIQLALGKSGYILISLDNFLVVALESSFSTVRAVPPRIVERYLPDPEVDDYDDMLEVADEGVDPDIVIEDEDDDEEDDHS
jgi:Zn finger protein HypA/HybF involved in hydrogenase expression